MRGFDPGIKRAAVVEVQAEKITRAEDTSEIQSLWTLVVRDRWNALARMEQLTKFVAFGDGRYRISYIVINVAIDIGTKQPARVTIKLKPRSTLIFRRHRFEGRVLELLRRNRLCSERNPAASVCCVTVTAGPVFCWDGRSDPGSASRSTDCWRVASWSSSNRSREWAPCPDCDQGCDSRAILRNVERLIAACPYDSRSDEILVADDVRAFSIDVENLCRAIREDTGLIGDDVSEIADGVWLLGALPRNGQTPLAIVLAFRLQDRDAADLLCSDQDPASARRGGGGHERRCRPPLSGDSS